MMEKVEKITRKNERFLYVFKEGVYFVLFSFFSALLPLILCLASAFISDQGSQAVMALGYVAPFQLSFMQISFMISTIIVFLLIRNKKKNENISKKSFFSSCFWIIFLISILFFVLYIGSSFLYIFYSTNKPNTQMTMIYGIQYIFATSFFVFLFPIKSLLFFYFYFYNKKKVLFLETLYNFTSFLFIFIIGIFLNKYQVILMGAIQTIILFMFVIYLTLHILLLDNIKIIPFWKINLLEIKSIIRVGTKEVGSATAISTFKAVAIIGISLVIPKTISDFVPLSYQMGRVIWFNMMYFVPFLGIGIAEAIRYHTLITHQNSICNIDHNLKWDWILIGGTMFITFLMCGGFSFLVLPLSKIYAKNDNTELDSYPELIGFGEINFDEKLPTITEIINLEWNPPLDSGGNVIPVPSEELNKLLNGETLSPYEKIKLISYFEKLAKFNQNNLSEIKVFFDFLNVKNSSGTTLLNFILTKDTNGDFTNLSNFVEWYAYLDLYSYSHPDITNVFINLRLDNNYDNPFINYLLNKKLTFNSKTLIYITIYGVCSSGWSILLQTSFRDSKKPFPYWLLTIVYFVCIGSLVAFGVLFGVELEDVLGNSNPFQYLDAWTFPLVIISFFAFTIVTIKSLVVNKKTNKTIDYYH